MQPVVMPPMRGFEPYPFGPGDAPPIPMPGQPVVLSGFGAEDGLAKKPLLPKWALPAALGLLALGGLALWYHLSVVKKLTAKHAGDASSEEDDVDFHDVETAPPTLKSRVAKRNPKKAQAAFAKAEKKAKKATAAWLAPKKRKSKTASATSKQESKLASTPAPKRRRKAAKELVAAAALPAHEPAASPAE